MPIKRKTVTKKKKTKNGSGRNPTKGESRTPFAVYVFFVFVLGIFLFALYHDYMANKPKNQETARKEKPEIKNQSDRKQKKFIRPHIVQEKPRRSVTQNKTEKRTFEKAVKPARKETSAQEQKLIAKRSPVKIPEPKDVEIPSHHEVKKTPIKEKPSSRPGARPKVAIVIDDMGISKQGATELLKVKANLTFSILPGQPYSRWVALEAYKRGHNIMAHVPMEPKDSNKNLGKGGLFLSMSDREIHKSFNNTIDSIPYAVGFNNHMGSAFTTDVNAMKAVMSAINGRKLFFLDSRTVSNSVGFSMAKANGLKAYNRDIFLDHKNTPEFIEKQWNKLMVVANRRGQAIAIGHPYKNTIAFLQKNLPSDEVDVVPVSHLRVY